MSNEGEISILEAISSDIFSEMLDSSKRVGTAICSGESENAEFWRGHYGGLKAAHGKIHVQLRWLRRSNDTPPEAEGVGG